MSEVVIDNPRRARNGGSLGTEDFADIGGCTDVRWQGAALVVEFDHDLTPAERETVRLRGESTGPEDENLRHRARAARDVDRRFIDTVGPQIVAGADAIINSTAASTREKDLARGIKALANHSDALSRQVIELGRIVLQDHEETP